MKTLKIMKMMVMMVSSCHTMVRIMTPTATMVIKLMNTVMMEQTMVKMKKMVKMVFLC